MTIARSVGFLIGSSKNAGNPLPAGGTIYGNSKDLLGDNTSSGKISLYLSCSAAVANSVVRLTVLLDMQPDTGTGFVNPLPLPVSLGLVNSLSRQFLGRFDVSRYAAATVVNDPDHGSALTNVALEYELEKTS